MNNPNTKAIESQGEEDANMVTAVEESRLLDVTMVWETETPRPTTAPTGIARPTVRDSPSLTENSMQPRQQPQYSSQGSNQGSNSDRESADEESKPKSDFGKPWKGTGGWSIWLKGWRRRETSQWGTRCAGIGQCWTPLSWITPTP